MESWPMCGIIKLSLYISMKGEKGKLSTRTRVTVFSILTGLITGFLVVGYRFILTTIETTRLEVFSSFDFSPSSRAFVWTMLSIGIALFLEFVVRQIPLISGSGIPQVKAYLIDQARQSPVSGIMLKFTGGIMAIFNGLSLGREGPSIQLGSFVGQAFGEGLSLDDEETKVIASAGASAGLAAAFNAPMAGLLFALEELYHGFSSDVMIACAFAGIMADIVSKSFFGFKPLFYIPINQPLPFEHYYVILIIGITASVLGMLFNKSLLLFSDAFKKLKFGKVLIPTLVSLILVLTFPYVLGGGHGIIESLVSGESSLIFLIVLLFLKFAFTCLSYASTAPGGIFLPVLSIGATIGTILYIVITFFIPALAPFSNSFLIFGMLGFFTAVSKAPVTGIILIIEITQTVPIFLSLAFVAILSYLITEVFGSEPIYDVLMKRLIADNK